MLVDLEKDTTVICDLFYRSAQFPSESQSNMRPWTTRKTREVHVGGDLQVPNVKVKGKAIKLLKQTKVKGTSSVQET